VSGSTIITGDWNRIERYKEMIPQDLQQALQRLKDGTHTPADLEALRRAVHTGQVTLATGERAVAIGGSADGAIIVTGDGNIVQVLSARQRADLERLLAARRYNIPPLPEHYVPREEYLAPLRQALLGDGAAALGIVGVRGMGGIGKSVLAAALALRLAELPRPDLYPLWDETLPLLARRTRRNLLADLRALVPVIHALGGDEAIAETFRAIQDTARWWP